MSLLSPPRKNALTPAQRRLYANALARDNALAGAVGAPGGLLGANALQPAPSPNYLKGGLLAGSFAPGLGDGLGLLGDLHMYATEPESRAPLNFGLSALGVLPFVPGAAIIKEMPAAKWRDKNAMPVPVGINPTPAELLELLDETKELPKDMRGVLRAIIGDNGDRYIWPVDQALHDDVARHFNLPHDARYQGGLVFSEDVAPNWRP